MHILSGFLNSLIQEPLTDRDKVFINNVSKLNNNQLIAYVEDSSGIKAISKACAEELIRRFKESGGDFTKYEATLKRFSIGTTEVFEVMKQIVKELAQ